MVSVESVFEVRVKSVAGQRLKGGSLVVGACRVAKTWDSVIWAGKKELFAGKVHN